jgi:hypothetical protein
MGGSAIASSSQPVPGSNSNSNRIDISSMTNLTRIENTQLVDGSLIVEDAMSLGGYTSCQISDLRSPLCSVVF